MDEDRLARIVDAIGAGEEPDPETYPQRVCDAGAGLLGKSGAGLTLMAEEVPSEVWASDTASRAVQDLQFALGEGPALDACRWRVPTLEPSLAASSRWPFFGPRAMGLGVEAVFSFPLQVGVICLGAVNLFQDCPATSPAASWPTRSS